MNNATKKRKITRYENLRDDATMLELTIKGSTFYKEEIHC